MIYPPLAFFNLGPWEIALIALFALLLFGGKRLPQLAKDMGEGIREFRKSLSHSDEPALPPSPPQQSTNPETVTSTQSSELPTTKKKRNAKS